MRQRSTAGTAGTAGAAVAADAPAPARFATVATPDGPFTIIAADAVLASGWTKDVGALLALIHPSLRPPAELLRQGGGDEARDTSADGLLRGGEDEAGGSSASPVLTQAVRALERYYCGDLEAPVQVPVTQRSGSFRQEAWNVLRGVPAGSVLTYTDYAQRCGRPRAVRAAAGACASNAAALFVPCHRVVRADGSLGGFRYGLAVKEALIRREARS